MRLFTCAATAAFMLVATPAVAQDAIPARSIFKTAGELYPLCTSAKADEIDKCEWYLMAAYDMATYYQDTKQIEVSFCLPTGTLSEKLREVAVDYWRAKPDSRKYSAVSTFLNALDAKHPAPCGN